MCIRIVLLIAYPSLHSVHEHTGKAAKRLRQTYQLESAVARILERLSPLAAREAFLPARAAAAARSGGGTASRGGAAPSAGGGGGGSLADMSVDQVAAMVGRRLGAEAARGLEEDLATYTSLCGALR